MDRGVVAILLVLLLMAPLTGSIAEGDNYDYDSNDFILINSGEFDGLSTAEAKTAITEHIENKKMSCCMKSNKIDLNVRHIYKSYDECCSKLERN